MNKNCGKYKCKCKKCTSIVPECEFGISLDIPTYTDLGAFLFGYGNGIYNNIGDYMKYRCFCKFQQFYDERAKAVAALKEIYEIDPCTTVTFLAGFQNGLYNVYIGGETDPRFYYRPYTVTEGVTVSLSKCCKAKVGDKVIISQHQFIDATTIPQFSIYWAFGTLQVYTNCDKHEKVLEIQYKYDTPLTLISTAETETGCQQGDHNIGTTSERFVGGTTASASFDCGKTYTGTYSININNFISFSVITTSVPCTSTVNFDLTYFSRYGLTGTVKQSESDCQGPVIPCQVTPTTTIPCTCPPTTDIGTTNPPRLMSNPYTPGQKPSDIMQNFKIN